MNPIDALLAGHALGDLDAAERERLGELLRQRPELRQRLDEFQTTLELLPLALPATAAPPPRLRQRLLERQVAITPERHGLRSVLAGWLLPALMGMGLLGLGLQLQQTRQQLAQLQERLESPPSPLSLPAVNRSVRLLPMDPAAPATGEVLVTGQQTHNMLTLDDLPMPPPNHTYRLWARVNGRDVGCVHFLPDARGHVAMPIPAYPSSQASTLSVSVEDDPTGQAPRGPMVLSSSI